MEMFVNDVHVRKLAGAILLYRMKAQKKHQKELNYHMSIVIYYVD